MSDDQDELPPCDPEIFKSGLAVCTFAAPSKITEPWVKKVAAESGQRVDWYVSGGRVSVLYIGDYAKVKAAVEKLLPELAVVCREHAIKEYGRVYEHDTYPEVFRFFPEESRGLYRQGDLVPAGTIAVDTSTGANQFIVRQPDAYTLGNTESYDQALTEEGPVHKLGRHSEDGEIYEGGIVFRTREEAKAYCAHHPELPYSVYGLLLPNGWEQDVHQVQGEDHHRLLNNAVIVGLENP